MTMPRHFQSPPRASQHLPAALGVHTVPQGGRHPCRRFRPGPDAPIGRRVLEGGGERLALGGGEQPRAAGVSVPPIPQAGWPLLVMALGECTPQIDGVPGHRRDLLRRAPPSEEPDDLPVAAANRPSGVRYRRSRASSEGCGVIKSRAGIHLCYIRTWYDIMPGGP
jgi:hypothetical protein